jgi:CheY-like chemotaxis protein
MRADPGAILVVEDDPDVREAMALLLETEGYEVRTAAEGRDALDQLRSAPAALVLLDLMMPVMDGFEFRTQQMQDPEIAEIPVIVISCGDELQRKAAVLRADACLRKPIPTPRLLELVARRVGRPHAPSHAARS